MSDWTMSDIGDEVIAGAKLNKAALVQAIRKVKANKVAVQVGVSETLISNMISDDDKLLRFCAVVAAAGLSFAPRDGRILDNAAANALLKLAAIGLQSMTQPGADE